MRREELERIKDEYIDTIIDEAKSGIHNGNVQILDTLTHTAKNIVKLIESCNDSYGMIGKRDSRGRYADDEWLRGRLHEMEEHAPNERMRSEVEQYGNRMR